MFRHPRRVRFKFGVSESASVSPLQSQCSPARAIHRLTVILDSSIGAFCHARIKPLPCWVVPVSHTIGPCFQLDLFYLGPRPFHAMIFFHPGSLQRSIVWPRQGREQCTGNILEHSLQGCVALKGKNMNFSPPIQSLIDTRGGCCARRKNNVYYSRVFCPD